MWGAGGGGVGQVAFTYPAYISVAGFEVNFTVCVNVCVCARAPERERGQTHAQSESERGREGR